MAVKILPLFALLLAFDPLADGATTAATLPSTRASVFPVRGLHMAVPGRKSLPTLLEFIVQVLPKEGVNTLILEFGYQFDFKSRPEFADPSALNRDDARKIAQACKQAGVELIPQLNCLGHQSWAANNAQLLSKHPEFDETPGKYPANKGIYCRSYCPLHSDVHKVLFALIDELIDACQARAFHVGMDEVFILADADCPRCKGKAPARLFADEVQLLHDHLREKGCRMWMWGDRLLDGKATGIGKWEASENGTHTSVDLVPQDIVICDWHYEKAHDTARFFAGKGFDVVSCPWRKPAVALGQLRALQAIRRDADTAIAGRALGMVQTTWCGFGPFLEAYKAHRPATAPAKSAPAETADCFIKLLEAMPTTSR